MSPTNLKTLVIGLSGPSSSGKTTLARLLRDVFNLQTRKTSIKLFIVHEDDFYKTDVDIPWRSWTSRSHGERKLQDWDCVESLDLPLLKRVLTHVKSEGQLPPDFASKEDQNSVGDMHVSTSVVESLRENVRIWVGRQVEDDGSLASGKGDGGQHRQEPETCTIQICILEGFLLFPPPSSLSSSSPSASASPSATTAPITASNLARGPFLLETESSPSPSPFPTSNEDLNQLSDILASTLDVKMFLPGTKALTIRRRGARTGYVTLEGFWEDPPGYVEELVWPNYVRDHGWLFKSVEDADLGLLDEHVARSRRILVGPGKGDDGMRLVLDWGVRVLKDHLLPLLSAA